LRSFPRSGRKKFKKSNSALSRKVSSLIALVFLWSILWMVESKKAIVVEVAEWVAKREKNY